jgi:quinol-cytochrome oxidoreductase complex cytochrome b subunit
MADMAGKFVGGAIALVMGVALIPVLADFVDQAQSNAAVTATQETVIGLVLTIFVLGMAYAAYQKLVQ